MAWLVPASPSGQGAAFVGGYDALSPSLANKGAFLASPKFYDKTLVRKRICFVCRNQMDAVKDKICSFCGSKEYDDILVKEADKQAFCKGFLHKLDDKHGATLETGKWKKRFCTLSKAECHMEIYANDMGASASELKGRLILKGAEMRVLPLACVRGHSGIVFSIQRPASDFGKERPPDFFEAANKLELDKWLVALQQIGVVFKGLYDACYTSVDSIKEGYVGYATKPHDKTTRVAYFILKPDSSLAYFKEKPASNTKKPATPLDVLMLRPGTTVTPELNSQDHAFAIIIAGPIHAGGSNISFYLRCRDAMDQVVWSQTLSSLIQGKPAEECKGLEERIVRSALDKARASDAPLANPVSGAQQATASPSGAGAGFQIVVNSPLPPVDKKPRPSPLEFSASPANKSVGATAKQVALAPAVLKIGASACLFLGCYKAPTLQCPVCQAHGLPDFTACSQECFSNAWATHEATAHAHIPKQAPQPPVIQSQLAAKPAPAQDLYFHDDSPPARTAQQTSQHPLYEFQANEAGESMLRQAGLQQPSSAPEPPTPTVKLADVYAAVPHLKPTGVVESDIDLLLPLDAVSLSV